MAIRFPKFNYGSRGEDVRSVGSSIRENIQPRNITQGVMGAAMTGGKLSPMGLLGFGNMFQTASQERQDLDRGARNTGVLNNSRDVQIGTPAGEPALYSDPPNIGPIYQDDNGNFWVQDRDGNWRHADDWQSTPGGGIDDRGGTGATGVDYPEQGGTR